MTIPVTPPTGCLIQLPDPEAESPPTTQVAFAREASRILERHCVEFHRAGEIGPFALEDYDEVIGWGDIQLEVIDQQRMPPWHADQTRLAPHVELQFHDPGLPAAPVVLATREAPTKAVLWLLGRASQPVAVADLFGQVRQLVPAESTARLEGAPAGGCSS